MDASEALAQLGIHLREWRAGQHYVKCPWCTGRSRTSLSVLVKSDGHAVFMCNRCEVKGSTHKLIREHDRLVREAARHGRPAPRPIPAKIEPRVPLQGKEVEPIAWGAAHDEFWAGLSEIKRDDPVGRYLLGRGCVLPRFGADLRYCPCLAQRHRRVADDDPNRWNPGHGAGPNDWRGPVMVGRITDAVTGAPIGLHFTWIAPDGSGKAPLDKPKLLARDMRKRGGAIRLCDPADLDRWLAVAEGIETALAGMRMLTMRPAWALIDSGNLAVMPVLPWVRELYVMVDFDRRNPRTGKRAGWAAAQELRRRYVAEQRRVRLLKPSVEGHDIADVVLSGAGPAL